MHKQIFIITVWLTLFGIQPFAQNLRFNEAIKNPSGAITDVVQDKQGIFWFAALEKGLIRYDGINTKTYMNDNRNPNSIAAKYAIRVYADKNNIVWVGTLGSGLERFDPSTNKFTHIRHDPKTVSGLNSDTVTAFLEDHVGNFWIGTFGGLSLMDRKTGKFTHYRNDPNDPTTISHNQVYEIYEDKNGTLWVYAGKHDLNTGTTSGTLNRFDRSTGKFTSYVKDPAHPGKVLPGPIRSFYEDNKNNFWIGTDSGLYNMDRKSNTFTRYYPDPYSSGPLEQTPLTKKNFPFVQIITGDSSGALWVGIRGGGLIRYDPRNKTSMHFGAIYENNKLMSSKDTSNGFASGYPGRAITSKEGLFWVFDRLAVYYLNYNKTFIPFYSIGDKGANAFYYDAKDNIFWVATDKGLLRKDLAGKKEKLFVNDPQNSNTITAGSISSMRADATGIFWLGTRGGLDKFDPATGKFIHYKHDPKNPGSIASNNLNYLFIDHNKNLWIASDSGISRMDTRTEQFINYQPEDKTNTPFPGELLCIAEDTDHNIWISSGGGVIKMDTKTGKFRKYISNTYMKSICTDAKGTVWAGGTDGIYFYDKTKDDFTTFANEQSPVGIHDVINIIEDNQQNLWVSTSNAIVKINAARDRVKKFTDDDGVHYTNFTFNDNYKASDGKLYLGIENGYYSFYPNEIKDTSIAPQLNISGLKLNDKEVTIGQNGILTAPIWSTDELRLKYNQNVFSFDFFAVDYVTPGDEKYSFMLENYDDTWHDIGNDRRASFFNVPPGSYIFRVKAVSGDGASVEKSIRIIISPPWWKTWWAYSLYALLAIIAGYLIFRYQRSYIVKRERQRTQQKELAQAREIEKAYNELKTTQQQLIQSEKMASLGELTAGIAHEIQNPLNFVNNFSEVNSELIAEMKQEIDNGNLNEARAIANSIDENEQKIIFHGKRADTIVKGMLQHSRNSSGQKEPTDINGLCDEYLRLSYHGLRAKDKSFNATMKTDFNESIGNINIIPQEIGRVVLNLINNAFYAVDEKRKHTSTSSVQNGYEPTVSVSTKRENGKIEIKVADNGNGIPQKVVDKIFQPFFTTKPTGQGTGLGLSLSYDIVKAHGGEIKVSTKENEGTEFTIHLNF